MKRLLLASAVLAVGLTGCATRGAVGPSTSSCIDIAMGTRTVTACFGAPYALGGSGAEHVVVVPILSLTNGSKQAEDFNSGDYRLVQTDSTLTDTVNPHGVGACAGWGAITVAAQRQYTTRQTICFSTKGGNDGLAVSWRPFFFGDPVTENLIPSTTLQR